MGKIRAQGRKKTPGQGVAMCYFCQIKIILCLSNLIIKYLSLYFVCIGFLFSSNVLLFYFTKIQKQTKKIYKNFGLRLIGS